MTGWGYSILFIMFIRSGLQIAEVKILISTTFCYILEHSSLDKKTYGRLRFCENGRNVFIGHHPTLKIF